MKTKRIMRPKNPVTKFLCPLCGVERGLRYHSKLQTKHHLQIILTTICITLILYPIANIKGSLSFFFIWGGFDFVRKINFRKEIACPECGFDATWYKRDVKMARKLVADFQAKIRPANVVNNFAKHDVPTESTSMTKEKKFPSQISDGLLATLKEPHHTETSV